MMDNNITDWNLDSVALGVSSMMGIVALVTLISNILILCAFVREPALWTPFNIYVVNLTLADLLLAILVMPATIHNTIRLIWRGSPAFCSFLLHCGMNCPGAALHTVMWMGIDRLWAAASPVHYYNHHSMLLSALVCVFMWIYLCSFSLPLILHDEWHYRDKGVCRIDVPSQPTYMLILELTHFVLPLLAIVIIYLLLVVTLKKRNKHTSTKPRSTNAISVISPPTDSLTDQSKRPLDNDARSREQDILDNEKRMIATLVLLAFGTVLLWAPAAVYFIMASYVDGLYNGTAIGLVTFIEYLSCVFNPFVYHRCVPDVRRAIHRCLSR